MARETRSPRSKAAGPGRTSKRSRTGARTRPPGEESRPATRPGRKSRQLPNGMGMTRRALALIVVLVVLALSYANSLRIFLGQQHDLAVAQQQISERSQRISELQGELKRWEDPAYVKAQARDRLGWVMPGEVGYRVIGPDGKVLGGGVVIESSEKLPPGEHQPMWWDRLWGSVQAADAPSRRGTSPG